MTAGRPPQPGLSETPVDAAPAGQPYQPKTVGRPAMPRPVPIVAPTTGAGRPATVAAVPAATTGPMPRPDDEDPSEHGDATEKLVRGAPPWLISLIVHTVALLIAGLVVLPQLVRDVIEVEVIYAEELGEQLEDDQLDMALLEPMDMDEAVLTPDDLPPVDDPLAAPPQVDLMLGAALSSSDLSVPDIGLALTGRQRGTKEALHAAYGGTATTEAAVQRGLEWLARNQLRDGAWSLQGPYGEGSYVENRVAATAMALLAFQGNGSTHLDEKYKENVARGMKALLGLQDNNGDFWPKEPIPRGATYNLQHRLYSQAQATIAVAELYGMTKDPALREPAQRAIDYAVKVQDDLGGWRYYPGQDSDTSVTGWFVMALQSGLMSGLEVPSPCLTKVSKYLDRAAVDKGARYGYRPGEGGRPSMTAEGLLCRQYLGWKHDDARLRAGVGVLHNNLIDWNKPDVYYWYYATQVCHHMEGDMWRRWNLVMRETLPKHQLRTGKEAGSWYPEGDRWTPHGGRLYSTCLCIYMLEVYYRHLPIYNAYRMM